MESVADLTIGKVAEIEVVYKTKVKASERPAISSSYNAYKAFLKLWDENKIELLEQFCVIFLNRNSKVLAYINMSMGGLDSTIVDVRLIFVAGLKVGATSMIVCHNHPSGNVKPSLSDIKITKQLKAGGEILSIKLQDHLIIAPESYYSFADEREL